MRRPVLPVKRRPGCPIAPMARNMQIDSNTFYKGTYVNNHGFQPPLDMVRGAYHAVPWQIDRSSFWRSRSSRRPVNGFPSGPIFVNWLAVKTVSMRRCLMHMDLWFGPRPASMPSCLIGPHVFESLPEQASDSMESILMPAVNVMSRFSTLLRRTHRPSSSSSFHQSPTNFGPGNGSRKPWNPINGSGCGRPVGLRSRWMR